MYVLWVREYEPKEEEPDPVSEVRELLRQETDKEVVREVGEMKRLLAILLLVMVAGSVVQATTPISRFYIVPTDDEIFYLPDYDAMVYIDGTDVIAVNRTGGIIDNGTAGTDDATVIQAAIDGITTGTVRIGTGSYSLSTGLTLTGSKRLIGNGMRNTLLTFTGTGNVIYLDGTTVRCDGAGVSDLYINANNQTALYLQGITPAVVTNGVFENIYLYNVSNGIKIAADSYQYENSFRNIAIVSYSVYGIYGIGGAYNVYDRIEIITPTTNGALAIKYAGEGEKFRNIVVEGVSRFEGQNVIVDGYTVETLGGITPTSDILITVVGYNSILRGIVISGVTVGKGLVIYNTNQYIESVRVYGASTITTPILLATGSSGTIANFNIAIDDATVEGWDIFGYNGARGSWSFIGGTLGDRYGANATIADGGTITHGFATRTPVWCTATPSVVNTSVSVTAMSATTFTLAIKNSTTGAAGTTQTIYWRCGI